MDAPKCKLCDKKHYGMCARMANKIHNAQITKVVEKAETNPDPFKMPELSDEQVQQDHKAFQTFLKQQEWKRNYQREYMRKRRAK